ncbi:hypothetical protein DDB_G0268406 [Dictyostelium discoideum AX4]|uniref:Uncharacterized protein n=1 Tax=Dictyostelium discoideum TaxID=44689 RepID=Q55FT0_DICDI|nr:hypothetical protein DDB_G0268406 [Dictyostelium discoideum AX4]EAL73656.1 hypothetical protein DDB_G0268406 [Dictyostelium discoideum AX4]|eukprot:XP_647453.1 hypothetical protein DDB_G0268406 [Dictyostelium discoideum AX4]
MNEQNENKSTWENLIENKIIKNGFLGCQILNLQGKNLYYYGSYYIDVIEESEIVNYFKESEKDLVNYISIKDLKFLITKDDENKLFGECLNKRIIILKTNNLFLVFWFDINTLSKENANLIVDNFSRTLSNAGYY